MRIISSASPSCPNSIKLVTDYWGLVKRFSDDFEKSTGIKQTTGDGPEAKAKFEGPLHERIALKGLLHHSECASGSRSARCRPSCTRSQETKNLEKAAVETIKTSLFTKDFLSDIVQSNHQQAVHVSAVGPRSLGRRP